MRDPGVLARIGSLAIPPAWTDVWICPSADGHIQATGRDARGRKQYRYHPGFRAHRDVDKFDRLVRFAARLPRIRRRVERDLARRGLPREKVLAAVVRLLELTRFRIGNAEYARMNRSFGLSTLRGRHARVVGHRIRFRFPGKGGRTHEAEVLDRRLAAVVRRCRDLRGQELFQYADGDETRSVTSDDVNAYIREAAGSDEFSAKDFRTWAATLLAYRALRDGSSPPVGRRPTAVRRLVMDAIRETAEALGNSPAVTRQSYVHPTLIEAFSADAAASAPPPPTRSGRTARADRHLPDRSEELELLALLRAATRPKAKGRPRRSGRVTGRRSVAACA